MTVALALAPEHKAEFDRICEEHRSDPPAGRVPSKPHRYERFAMPAVTGETIASLKALRANPMADDADALRPARTSLSLADKLKAFGEAVAAKYPLGSKVSIAMAAEAAGVSDVTAHDRIGHLKRRGDWPFAPGATGRRAVASEVAAKPSPTPAPPKPRPSGRRVGTLRLDGLDLDMTGVKASGPEPAREEAARPTPATVQPEPAPKPSAAPAAVDLAAMAARLREAADLIDRAAALIGAGS